MAWTATPAPHGSVPGSPGCGTPTCAATNVPRSGRAAGSRPARCPHDLFGRGSGRDVEEGNAQQHGGPGLHDLGKGRAVAGPQALEQVRLGRAPVNREGCRVRLLAACCLLLVRGHREPMAARNIMESGDRRHQGLSSRAPMRQFTRPFPTASVKPPSPRIRVGVAGTASPAPDLIPGTLPRGASAVVAGDLSAPPSDDRRGDGAPARFRSCPSKAPSGRQGPASGCRPGGVAGPG
jgi:hypothetical protein